MLQGQQAQPERGEAPGQRLTVEGDKAVVGQVALTLHPGLVAAGLVLHQRIGLGLGLIWCAHIGFDRALGYGLKSPEGFRLTHLGKIGRDQPPR